MEIALGIKGIGHCDVQIAGETLLAVRMEVMQDDGRISHRYYVPYYHIQALESAVKRIAIVIQRSLILNSFHTETAFSDTVGDRADAGTEETLPGRSDVIEDIVVADNYIFIIAIPVRGKNRDHASAEIRQLESDVSALQSVQGDLFPIIFGIEIILRDQIELFAARAEGGKAGQAEKEFFHLLKTLFQTFHEGLRGLGTRQEHFHSPETGIIFIGPYSLERENLLYTATAGRDF